MTSLMEKPERMETTPMADPDKDYMPPETLTTKLVRVLCCTESCRVWCQQCLEQADPTPRKPRRLTKRDIRHTTITHQPVSFTSSDASRTSTDTGRSFSYRDRTDSAGSSRKGSTSSSPDPRKPTVPVIDMKPIEFWTANRETVQPRTPRRRLPSESELSVETFQIDLYEEPDVSDEPLTDEEKLARFKLGQVHLSLHYLVPEQTLQVRVLEARDLPLPACLDATRQDLAHSNPYAKVSLLPDQKDSRQTGVQRKTQCPVWSDVFEFELPFKEVQRRTLEVTLKDFDKYSRHCIIGQVHLPLDNINLIKGGHMWKPLQPSTKELSDLGEILLSLNYLPSAGRLNVDIIKAKQLLQTDLVGGSDPFVKLHLCHGTKVLKTRKTSTKKNTIDPVFNESLSFNLTIEQLEACSLVVTVWDYNSKSKDDFVGRIVLGKQATGPYEVTHWNRMLQCQRSPVAQWHTMRAREECDQISSVSSAVS